MRTNEFMKKVAGYGQLSSTTEARESTRATLLTLAELLPQDTAEDLAAQLDDDLREWVTSDADGFLQRVAARLRGDVPFSQIRQESHLVLTTLHEAVTPETWEALVARLPQDFEPPLR